MRKSISVLFFLCVAACAAQQPYRDATNRGRTTQDMQADGAICQTVLPSPTPPKPPTLCPACDLIESAEAKIKRQRLFDNCMRSRGWEVAR
jgi:hypothetical protein